MSQSTFIGNVPPPRPNLVGLKPRQQARVASTYLKHPLDKYTNSLL